MNHTTAPNDIVYAAACQGYQLSPGLVRLLSGMCMIAVAVTIDTVIRMYPDELVLDLTHLSDAWGIVIIMSEW